MGLVNDLTQIINIELFEWKIFALSCPTHSFRAYLVMCQVTDMHTNMNEVYLLPTAGNFAKIHMTFLPLFSTLCFPVFC